MQQKSIIHRLYRHKEVISRVGLNKYGEISNELPEPSAIKKRGMFTPSLRDIFFEYTTAKFTSRRRFLSLVFCDQKMRAVCRTESDKREHL